MPFIAEEQADDEVFIAPEAPEDVGPPPIPDAQLRPSPTFGERLGRAYDAFQTKVRPKGIADALDPFRFPAALGAAAEELAPNVRDALSPLIGPSESQRLSQSAVPGERSKVDTEGLIPGVVGAMSRIEPVAEFAEGLKAKPDPNDSLLDATGKAAKNVALDIGVSLASPAGALLAETGSIAPRSTAAALSPLVMKSISESAALVASDENDQKKIESVLMSIIGVAGTVAAVKAGSPKPTKTAKVTPATGIASEAVEGAAALESDLGIPAPLTAAEATGSVGTARREAFVKRIGAGDGTRPLTYQLQQEAISEAVQNKIRTSAEEAGPKAEVGAQVAKEITSGEETLRGGVEEAAGKAAGEVASAAEGAVRAIGPAEEATALGGRIRSGGQFTIDANKSKANSLFQDAEALRLSKGGASKFIAPTETQKTGEALRNASSSQAGKPLEGLAPGQRLIEQLRGWTDLQSLEQFNQAISTVGEAIGRKDAGLADVFGPGFNKGNLKQIYKALITDRDNALNKLGSDVKSKYDIARKFYKENIDDFNQNPIISKTLNDPSNGGIPNVGEIASMFARGEGKLGDLKAIGTLLSNEDFSALKAGILDSLRSRSTIPTATGHVEDLTGFAKSFRELAPEFKREVMGSDKAANELQSTLDQFGVAKQAVDILGQRKVASPEAMQGLIDDIRSGDSKLGRKRFGEAIAKDAARSRDYFNEITKDIRSGNLGRITSDPGRFVDDFLLKSDDVNTVRTALQQLEPETRENVRRLVSQKFFELAADQENSTVAQLLKGEPEISGSKLIDLFIKDPKRRAVVQALVPEEHKELISNFIKYQRGIENARKQGGSSGLVAGQAQFGGGRRGGILSIIPQLAESVLKLRVNRFVAKAFFSNPIQSIMKSVAGGDFLTTAVAASLLANVPSVSQAGKIAVAIPKLTRDGLMALSEQFGVTKVREYLDKKREIDAEMAKMSEDEVDAMFIVAPELATPIEVEGEAKSQ